MSVDLSSFNPATVEDQKFGLMPKGPQVVIITESEAKDSSTGNRYLNFKLQVVKGEYTGRTIYYRLNLWHSSPQTRSIAESQLKAIYTALGKTGQLRDTTELHDKPFEVVLKIKPDMQGQDRNEVSYVKTPKVGGALPTATQARVDAGKTGVAAAFGDDQDIPF